MTFAASTWIASKFINWTECLLIHAPSFDYHINAGLMNEPNSSIAATLSAGLRATFWALYL